MLNIFIGLFFIFFDPDINLTEIFSFDLQLGTSDMVIGLLPGFIGYGLIYLGLRSLSGKSKHLTNAQYISAFAMFIDLIRWTCKALGITLGVVNTVFAFITLACFIVMLFFIVQGIKAFADADGININQTKLKISYIFVAVIRVMFDLFGLSILASASGFGIFLSLLLVIAEVVFILRFYKTMKLYYNALRS